MIFQSHKGDDTMLGYVPPLNDTETALKTEPPATPYVPPVAQSRAYSV